MIITYLRSSSYSTHEMCPMQYYLEYTLGWRGSTNKKAEKGTIVHKALEVLGDVKLTRQAGKRKTFMDSIVGKVHIEKHDIEDIVEKCYIHYSKASINEWADLDLKECIKWTFKAIEYKEGEYDPRNSDIVAVEQRFDFSIDKPWAMYDYEFPSGDKVDGFLSVKGTIDQISQIDDDTYMILDWKGLPVETPIPTPRGWTTMGEISVGDTTFDIEGKPTKVIAKSQKNYKECYKITFDESSTVVCDNEHLWVLDSGETVCVTELNIGDKIDVAEPLSIEQKDLPIDPYVLGVWLCKGDNISEPREDLEGLKCVPEIYFRSSYEQRLELLRGLLDEDSDEMVFHQYVFTSNNEMLILDIKRILLTLGNRIDRISSNSIVFPIYFKPIDRDTSLPLKNLHRSRSIEKIEKLNTELNTQCIAVDSPTNTYLCTENMIPTHNTGRRWDWAKDQKKTHETLMNDPQLLMYYYAARHLFPKIKHFMVTIYFINDGGPYTVCFSEEDVPRIERMLQQKFEDIEGTDIPRRNRSWKCGKFCHFGTNTFKNTRIKPILERRPNQVCKIADSMTMCEQTAYCLQHRPQSSVIKHMSAPGHKIDFYKAPGEVE